MKITAYRLNTTDLPIEPCSPNRDWMEFYDRFPYRCLPLTIANATGWDILMNADVEMVWDGGLGTKSLQITNRSPENAWCTSHFGHGILTMNLPYLFTTPKGVDLWARGPSNVTNPLIQPLEGIIETWWAPFTFTMNWQCLAINRPITLKKGDIACRITPYPHNYIQQFDAEILNIADNRELHRQYLVWNKSRTDFNAEAKAAGTSGHTWQKHYHTGENFTTGAMIADHVTAVKAAAFLSPEKRKAKESLSWQLSELLGAGVPVEKILATLNDTEMTQNRGGGEVTMERLVEAYKDLWRTDENTRYLVRLSDTELHPGLFTTYEQAVAFVNGRHLDILRVQV